MDPIANMLVQIKNAGAAKLPSVMVPYSSIKFEIANVLQKEGYIGDVAKKGKKVKKFIEIAVVYKKGKEPRIADVRRMSKPSKRMYLGVKEIRSVRQGSGLAVLSTPKGIMTEKEAKKEHVGGEILFTIW